MDTDDDFYYDYFGIPCRRPTPRPPRVDRAFLQTCTYRQLEDNFNLLVDEEDALVDCAKTVTRTRIPCLNLDLDDGAWVVVEQYEHHGSMLTAGDCLRLNNGMFLRIRTILSDVAASEGNRTIFRGHRLILLARLAPLLEDETHRELFLDFQSDNRSYLDVESQSLIDAPVTFVEDRIADIRFTNCLPQERPDDISPEHRDGATYFCRWKMIRSMEYRDQGRRTTATKLSRLRYHEADGEHRIPDELLRLEWRGEEPSGTGEYTALDGFCCSGGWSRGATMAGGITVLSAFDLDPNACASYKLNFPDVDCQNVDAHGYCISDISDNPNGDSALEAGTRRRLDIAHYSTPCQYFSPAHTRPAPERDARNVAASFCLLELLRKDRPRVMTFENTSGLESTHFGLLKAIFGQVTSLGYSIRFATLNFAQYGLPQQRKRLIMVASCPGESLPEFPPPTHKMTGTPLRGGSPVTVENTLASMRHHPTDHVHHRPRDMRKMVVPEAKGNLAPTITCSGSSIVHPDGRALTVRENQALQGFPLTHRFPTSISRTAILAQIGNAFPPVFVEKLLRHIRLQLQIDDGVPGAKQQLDGLVSEPEWSATLGEDGSLVWMDNVRSRPYIPKPTTAPRTYDDDEFWTFGILRRKTGPGESRENPYIL